MKKYLIITMFLAPVLAWTQILDRNQDYQIQDSSKIVFGIRTHGFNNSNALTGRVLNNAFYGGFIDNSQKEHMLNRANPTNSSGSIWNSSLYYAQRIDSIRGKQQTGLNLFINVAHRVENLALFSDLALQLALNGNKQFAGKTVSLKPLAFNSFRYSQFQLGIRKDFANGNGLTFGASFLYGNSSQNLQVDRMDVIVSETGDRLSSDAEFVLNETNRNNQDFMAYNGAGISVDLEGRFAVHLMNDSSNAGIFHFAISDLGFIQWHGDGMQTEVDTFYSYTGLHVANIFDPNSTTTGNPENIWDSISTQSQNSYLMYTPATIHFYLEQSYQKFIFIVGGAHRNKGFFYPYFYGKCGYQLSTRLTASGQINYGGYGKLGGGLELKHEGKNHIFEIGSTNMEGFLSPDKWGGQSIYFQIAAKL